MSTGLKAPSARGLARPAPVKKSGLARPTTGLTKTPSANKVSGKLAGSRESITSGPIRSASRSALKSSASSQSINSGLSRSGSSASVNDMNPLKVGTRVKTKDTKLEGTVRFCGEPQFASGIWVGVELDTENGKNDGEVKGVRYFQCEPQHGLFCKPDKLNRIKEPAMRPIRTPSNVNVSKVNYEAKFGLRIGGRCIVNETKEGTLLFVGLTQFAKGVWAGVALDTDDGKNDGSVKGERYFTCDPGFGLFSQAAKIKMIDSPLSSTTSLSSFDTPRKASVNNNGEEVMKPDFINRTPASTPGIKSSLSGLLSKSRDENNKNRDIESMQKNIGDLQQRLSEVTSPTTKNGPAIPSTPSTRLNSTSSNHSPDQYEQLKQLHEESEKARNDLAEKVKASENEKLTFEARLAEVAEAADKEKSGLNFKLEQQNKEIVVLKSNNSSQISKLQDEINNLETELAISLDKIGDYESSALQNDNSGEIAMNQEQIAELQAELKKINHAIDQDQSKIAHLESELSDALLLSETLQSDINQMTASQDGAAGQFSTAQSRIKELEAQLADATSSLSDYKSNSDSCTADFVAEREINKELSEELESFKQQSSDLDNEIFSMRSAHESYVQSSDNKLSKLEDQLQEEGQTLAKLRSELSELSSSSSSDKIHLEQKLQDSLNSISRLQEQAARDAARISDLDNMLSSAESDGSSELIVAHKKISELENVLKERKTASDVELREVNDTVTELRVELSREKQLASEQLEIGNKKCKDLQVSYDQIQMERSMEQIQTEKEIGELQLQLAETDKLRSDNSRLNNNINTLQTQLSTLQTKCDNLQDSNKGISRLQDQMESERTEHANLVASLENNIDELETRLAIANNDKAAQSEMSAKNEAVMQAQITSLERETERLREQLVEQEVKAEERITKLEAQLGEIATISTEKTAEIAELREELDGCKDQLNDSELQLRDLAEEYDSKRVELEGSQATVTELESHMKHLTDEKRVLSSELLTITKELGELKIKTNRQSDEEIENLHKQINNLTEENDMLKLDFQEKNAEFDDLTMEVTNLREISETAFTEIKKNELQFTTSVKKLKTTEIQLDEALGRMRDLQCKINDLEEEVVRERSRTHELEQRLNSPPVMSFENIDNLSNISSSPPITAPGFIPNRVFCDNCDVFDEHDTENCPVEFDDYSLEVEDEVDRGVSPGGIRHGGLRGLSGRPYCTVCEMFGHTAAECEDDMTF
ncbi:CAP-Gly domain-containing linker protein 1-like isoform X20 [Bolinopsis microptera]|uniref:CAP-Gly domain-containing linker protein 1-like isoform X20 n=1 Tax=Bolinopsis microptera TaxID=2820187 RepID=UPI00307A2ED1